MEMWVRLSQKVHFLSSPQAASEDELAIMTDKLSQFWQSTDSFERAMLTLYDVCLGTDEEREEASRANFLAGGIINSNSPPASGSTVPNGTRAMSPTGYGAPQDVDDLRRAISPPGIQPRNRSLNNAPAQSSPNTKSKAPARPRRDDGGELFGTDDGNRTDTGATIESITTSRDHTPSPDQTPSGSDPYGNVQPPNVASMAMSGLGTQNPSPVPSGGSPGPNGNGNGRA
ncbi:hypothetical protein P692DRAFT_20893598 [Suillus brevipes Sb2]|nr:hypothetical protein P692DRAFT_20893598 [Suillus brevipes Sb2]